MCLCVCVVGVGWGVPLYSIDTYGYRIRHLNSKWRIFIFVDFDLHKANRVFLLICISLISLVAGVCLYHT